MKCLIKIIVLVFFVQLTKAQYQPQENVRPLHDCSCDGFILKAAECKWKNWKSKQCDEESEYYINYKWHCDRINNFRVDKMTGAIPSQYNQTVSCRTNLSPEQILSYNGLRPSLRQPTPRSLTNNPKYPANLAVPKTAIDWRSTMTPIKDQGPCGSCWAFAANGLCEWYYSHIMKTTKILSEQCLIDCERIDAGCDGGWPATVLEYLTTTGTVESSFYTPAYTAAQAATCPVPSSEVRTKCPITSEELYTTKAAGNCNRLKALLTKGPVYVGIYASGAGFSTYTSGVYTSTVKKDANHAVLIVGWIPNYQAPGTTTSKPVWIMRNSWGSSWGQSGYMYIDASKNIIRTCNRFWYYMV